MRTEITKKEIIVIKTDDETYLYDIENNVYYKGYGGNSYELEASSNIDDEIKEAVEIHILYNR